jgi:inorganic pyrophosphatase
VAVLKDDAIWSEARDISDLPARLVERMQHYFLTYKMRPGEQSTVQVKIIYGVERARTVVEASMADYREAFPT